MCTVVWFGVGDPAKRLESMFDWAARSGRELFHRGPLSDAGEGIWWEPFSAEITAVAVEVEDAAEDDAADDTRRVGPDVSATDDAIYAVSAPSWGRATVEDAALDAEEGGDGRREAPPLVEGACVFATADFCALSHSVRARRVESAVRFV